MRRLLAVSLMTAGLAAAGCGGGGSDAKRKATATPEPLPTDRVGIARAWAEAVRRNDLDRAGRLFAIPALVANGTPPFTLASAADVRVFNSSFPCGATFVRARKLSGGRILATYTLTERPGAPMPCGSGVGARAGVLFTIAGGKITRWFRAQPDTGPARTPAPQV